MIMMEKNHAELIKDPRPHSIVVKGDALQKILMPLNLRKKVNT